MFTGLLFQRNTLCMFLCVCKNCIKFSTLCISSTENGSSFELLILQLWKSLALLQKQSFASVIANSLNWAVSFHTFSVIMRCSLCINWILFCAGTKINPVL